MLESSCYGPTYEAHSIARLSSSGGVIVFILADGDGPPVVTVFCSWSSLV